MKRDEELQSKWGTHRNRRKKTSSKRSQQLDWALKEALPKEQGRRHRQVFELARHLLAVDGITQDIPVVKLKPIVEKWHNMALEQAESSGFTIHGDAEESWSDFQFAWARVKHPIGGLTNAFLKEAVDAGLITANPFGSIKIERQINNSRQRFIESSVINRGIETCPDDEMKLVIALSRRGGLCTPSEPFSLKWKHIDLNRRQVLVHCVKTKTKGKKTREIPLFPELVPFVEKLRLMATVYGDAWT
jgi:hypothetical protein